MNSENFHEYLKTPSKLHQVSYQELKSLVLQYPFSPNLRYLLMVKSMFDQNKDHDRNLTLASMYSPDRKKLWQLMMQNSQLKASKENYELNEDFLELKDLSSIEDVLESHPSDIEEVASPLVMQWKEEPLAPDNILDKTVDDEKLDFLAEDEDLDFLEELLSGPYEVEGGLPGPETQHSELSGGRQQETADNPPAEEDHAGEPPSLEDLLETLEPGTEANTGREEHFDQQMTDLEHIVSADEFPGDASPSDEGDLAGALDETAQPEEVQPTSLPKDQDPTEPATQDKPTPPPLPKDAFRSWRQDIRPANASLLSGDLKSLANRKKTDFLDDPEDDFEDDYPEAEAQLFALKSVQEDTGIASETLALVLEKQEHYEKAIAMYERLALQNPEKRSFFAAKIQHLKNKL